MQKLVLALVAIFAIAATLSGCGVSSSNSSTGGYTTAAAAAAPAPSASNTAASSPSPPAVTVAAPPAVGIALPPAVSTAAPPANTSTSTVTSTSTSTLDSSTAAGSSTAASKPQSSTAVTPTLKKSIGGWVSCSGTSDDAEGVAKAFNAAQGGAFTLVVDCPVRMNIGTDIARTVFIESGTTVEFSGAGKIIVDNVLHPAFAMVNADHITLTNWQVEYDASLPVNSNLGGFLNNGQHVSVPNSTTQPANAFNDITLTAYMTAHRAVKFDQSQGPMYARWAGPTNTCAVFYLSGNTSNVTVTGLHLYAPASADGSRFIPAAFSMNPNYRNNQTVTARTPADVAHLAVPHDLIFSNVEFDGTYMGWVGNVQHATYENIKSHRYGDLQDAKGQNVGGIDKWFAPPHLFYLNDGSMTDQALLNTDIDIKNVVDDGPRVGAARDKGGSDSISGYTLSIKIGCTNCSVDTYTSTRPDGFIDVLPSDGLTVSNATASYDSSFTNGLYPGWRFPGTAAYKHVTFQNISLTDVASNSVQGPIGNAPQVDNADLIFDNVHVGMKRWGRTSSPLPTLTGRTNSVVLDYMVGGTTQFVGSQNGDISVNLQATPVNLQVGASATVTWLARNSATCNATGAAGFTGGVGNSGSRSVKFNTSGRAVLTIECRNSSYAVSASVQVTIQ